MEDDVKPNLFQRGKKGTWCLRIWVPDRFRAVEPRKELFVSMKTSDWAEASSAALAVQQEIMASLNARLLGVEQPGGREHYERVRDLALARGYAYKPAAELAAGPLEDLLSRIESLARRDPQANDRAAVEAVLGGVQAPGLMLSGLFEEFERIGKDKVRGKTEDQLRRWRNPRIKAVRNLVGVVGDRALDQVGKAEALAFKIWWTERIEDSADRASEPGTANKDVYYLGAMLSAVLHAHGKDDPRPFNKMKLQDGGGREIEPFTNDWIRDVLLCADPLPGLNAEARDVLLAMVNTGCRPSELLGLRPADIALDAPVPYIDINDHVRSLKTDASERQIPLWGVSLEAMTRRRDGFPTYRDKDLWSTTANKFLRENGVLPSDRHRAYSLRHSFEDRMTDAEIPERTAADMMGHTIARERYGKGPSLEKKLEVIRRIAVSPDR